MRNFFLSLLCFPGIFQFSCSGKVQPEQKAYADTLRIGRDLQTITGTAERRNYLHPQSLDSVAGFIFSELSKYCDTVYYQTFTVNGTEYKNVVGSLGTHIPERIIVGAHYDVAGDQEGADDNASGVTGVLELARLLSGEHLNYRIDFVAYTLEEPPFFRSEYMGSYIHARSLKEENVKGKGMICLEMIGYYDDTPGSQKYPAGFLRLFYGNKGDFITVVQKYGNGRFGRRFKKLMKNRGLIKTRSFRGPSFIPGVDFSDHLNYWKFGFNALMITNTSFYRNPNYHKNTDKLETLDIKRISKVIDEVYLTIKVL